MHPVRFSEPPARGTEVETRAGAVNRPFSWAPPGASSLPDCMTSYACSWQGYRRRRGVQAPREKRVESPRAAEWTLDAGREDLKQPMSAKRLLFGDAARARLPSPGLVLTGIDDRGGRTTVSLCRFFYGENAGALAAESEPRTREWLNQRFGAYRRTAAPRHIDSMLSHLQDAIMANATNIQDVHLLLLDTLSDWLLPTADGRSVVERLWPDPRGFARRADRAGGRRVELRRVRATRLPTLRRASVRSAVCARCSRHSQGNSDVSPSDEARATLSSPATPEYCAAASAASSTARVPSSVCSDAPSPSRPFQSTVAVSLKIRRVVRRVSSPMSSSASSAAKASSSRRSNAAGAPLR